MLAEVYVALNAKLVAAAVFVPVYKILRRKGNVASIICDGLEGRMKVVRLSINKATFHTIASAAHLPVQVTPVPCVLQMDCKLL